MFAKVRLSVFTALFFVLAVLNNGLVRGQDAPALWQIPPGVTYCRDPRFATVRIEFHHVPDSWINGTEHNGFWSLGESAPTVYPQAGDNVIYMDALEQYEWNELGIKPGVAILGTADYAYEIRGDEHAPACNLAESPVQDPNDPNPPLYPGDGVGTVQCDHRAIDPATGNYYCFQPGAGGVIPLPPAPSGSE